MNEIKIIDKCPSCHSKGTLFIGAGGYLTCSFIGCPEPGVGRAIAALRAELEAANKAVVFVNALLDEYYPDPGDIDGGTFQDLAVKHGVLVAEIRHEPCGEGCACAEVYYHTDWIEGVECFRPAIWLTAHPAQSAGQDSKEQP